ncbi:TPA: hypothetical protein VJP16_000992 [Streptococcus pyogenes]|uniref:hypothetical protein n=1 Tax=Streptococcus pyogenes TaxID=1314 RepID=UPI0006A5BE4E|nr:hypothetical protein [Streptococcus pyogenes]HER4572404.1 hypothetical protein [Streptococcus pyogenes NGAS641]HER4601243.1 hypothetical protein [Streptococcus pyogenes NGAS625]HER4629832.1 hypothetical protein [Streptococcus pyogenes NGAS599]HER4701075.1 hypothetical protein [Streptococcus pyogenes NGAS322]AKZ50730.1 phage protein [Streptococcus pyogenes]
MKPRKYPYSGKIRIIKKELPRFVRSGDFAFNSNLVKHIDKIRQVKPNETLIRFKIPKLFMTYEEEAFKVRLGIDKVVKILNQY